MEILLETFFLTISWNDLTVGPILQTNLHQNRKIPCTNLIHRTELMNALVKPHHRRQKAQSRKKAQCCRFGCFRLVFSSSRRLRSLWRQICKITNAKNGKTIGLGTGKTYFVPWEQGWGWVWQQWRMWRPPRELGKRHSSRTLSLKRPFVGSECDWGVKCCKFLLWKNLIPISVSFVVVHLWCRSCPSEVAPEFVRIILFHDKSVKIKDYELVRLSCKSKVNSMPRVTRVVASHWTKGCIFNFALNSTQLLLGKIKLWFFLSANFKLLLI